MEWNNEDIHIIRCFGDSLTAGYGALPGQGWVSRLEKKHPDISFYNHGMCGAGVADILDQAECYISLADKREGFFFLGGTNDILCGMRLESLEKQVEQRVKQIAAKVPLTLGIPPLATKESIFCGWQSEYNYERNQEDLDHYGDFLRRLATTCHLPCIDFSKAFPLDDAWYSDGLHPNEKGYEKMAELAEKVWFETGETGKTGC